ncbi:angiopoietin-related protein 1 [Elysia marginata]|uniref:Angiopoietin-related protein 1 n=1 Tax=Elysia marginata TaxID=1093978 RepID=A0AAV4G3K5_9GAST|nr:angiopoietin-related protein 1 [Elysia marginata]
MLSHTGQLLVAAWLQCIFVPAVAGSPESQCSAIFHVWQPGQDALQMIHNFDLKMNNLTSFTRAEILETKARLSEELSRVQNWTHAVDKRVFQLQIDRMDDEMMQLKFSAGSAKVKMQLDRVNRRVADLERSIYNVESKMQGGGNTPFRPPDHSRPQQQGITEDLEYMLKNSISDLKSEWILLKRDIEYLKKETATLSSKQAQLTNDTVSLKFSLGLTNADNRRLETRLLTMSDQQDKLDSKFEEVTIDTESIKRKLEEDRLADAHRGANLIALQARLSAVENNLKDIQRELDSKPSPDTVLVLGQEDAREKTHWTGLEAEEGVPRKQSSGDGSAQQAGREGAQHQEGIFPKGKRTIVISMFTTAKKFTKVGFLYTLIQRRIDGTLGFNRGWSEYKHGFGNPYGEIWVGNELIHLLSTQVKGEKDNYRLFVGGFTGSAGDSLSYHNMMAFSTEDVDNDLHERHCAAENKGGWWYSSCFYSQLNGLYHTAWYSQTNYADGIVWYTLKDSEFYSLKKVEMKLKPLPV